MAMYLGFDASTQSVTATIIETGNGRREVVFEHALNFDESFPEFGTANGVVRGADGVTVTTPALCRCAALDRLLWNPWRTKVSTASASPPSRAPASSTAAST